MSEAGFELVAVEARPFERRVSLRALMAPIAAVRSVKACRPLVEAADVVVGMGGYVSVPVVLAALRSRRPVVLHEQNAVPGLANRAFARPARTVALAFAEARRAFPRRARTVVTGNPVREDILAVATDRERLAKEARAELELDDGKRTIVVFGGSQGALHVNRAFAEALRVLGPRGSAGAAAGRSGPRRGRSRVAPGRRHRDGARAGVPRTDGARVRGRRRRRGARRRDDDRGDRRLRAPVVLVPYPYATGRHQEANARALQRAGGATMVLDDELDGRVLADRIEWLLSDDQRLRVDGRTRPRVVEAGRRERARARRSSRRGVGDERLPSAARFDPDAGGAGPRRRPARAHDRHRRRGDAQPRAAVPRAGCRRDGFGPEGLGGHAGAPRARGNDRHRSRRGRTWATPTRSSSRARSATTTPNSSRRDAAGSRRGRGRRPSPPPRPTGVRSPSPERTARRRRPR